MKKTARKRRTREHVISDLSVNHVERQALCGYTIERMAHGADSNGECGQPSGNPQVRSFSGPSPCADERGGPR